MRPDEANNGALASMADMPPIADCVEHCQCQAAVDGVVAWASVAASDKCSGTSEVHRASALHMQMRCVKVRVGSEVEASLRLKLETYAACGSY